MTTDFDLIITGSGFGGSLLAMVARRLGLRVALLERGTHPRFAIGESTSPLMNLMIEQLAERYDLPRLLPLTTYGAWQKTYPEITCGLKRGFTYYHQEAGKPFQPDPERRNQLMVAASPRDEIADTHWLRSDVDWFLVREAVALGVGYLDEACLRGVEFAGTGAIVTGERGGKPFRLSGKLLIDASGPRGFLSRALDLPESEFASYPRTQALFSHFTDVRRCDAMDTFHSEGQPPYAADDAALHHVFDGGWMWVLGFGNGVTSAGFAVQETLASELKLAEGEAGWQRFLERFPSIGEQFAEAKPVVPFIHAPRLTYRAEVVAGENWALLPSAASFVDPLFSTGMPLTLLGIERLGRILEEAWDTPELPRRLQEYADLTLADADWTALFIGGCYAAMPRFPLFSAFSMFYFAAASYSEMARRLGKPHLVRRFLAGDQPAFAAGMRHCAELLKSRASELDAGEFAREVALRTHCLNIAGLNDPDKRNWYGVDLKDVIQGAVKFGMRPEEIEQIIATASWV